MPPKLLENTMDMIQNMRRFWRQRASETGGIEALGHSGPLWKLYTAKLAYADKKFNFPVSDVL